MDAWLESNWQPIEEHVCTGAARLNLCTGKDIITHAELHQRANAHLLEITTILLLLLLVLLVDLVMACLLQYLVSRHGPTPLPSAGEVERLVDDDPDL